MGLSAASYLSLFGRYPKEKSKTATRFLQSHLFTLIIVKQSTCVCMYISSKQIKPGSPDCSGFEANSKSFKT